MLERGRDIDCLARAVAPARRERCGGCCSIDPAFSTVRSSWLYTICQCCRRPCIRIHLLSRQQSNGQYRELNVGRYAQMRQADAESTSATATVRVIDSRSVHDTTSCGCRAPMNSIIVRGSISAQVFRLKPQVRLHKICLDHVL